MCLGVAPPQGWLRSAELVALRTQREGQQQEGAPRATSELLNELLVVAGAFQRLGHVPERAFVALMGEVRPLEEVQAGNKVRRVVEGEAERLEEITVVGVEGS